MGQLGLRRFQLAGHRPFPLAGGATGVVGDPGGRSEERNLLDRETLERNLAGIKPQLERLLDFERGTNAATLVDNATWTANVPLLDFLRDVGKHVTVNQMIAKESVRSRLDGEHGISFTEFSYMLLQANDFRHLHDDYGVELQMGGSDQWGNITAGIDLIRRDVRSHRPRTDVAAAAAQRRAEVRQVDRQRGVALAGANQSVPVPSVLGADRRRRHRRTPAAVQHATGRGDRGDRRRARVGTGTAASPSASSPTSSPSWSTGESPPTPPMRPPRSSSAAIRRRHSAPRSRSSAAKCRPRRCAPTTSAIRSTCSSATGLASSRSDARRLLEQRSIRANGAQLESRRRPRRRRPCCTSATSCCARASTRITWSRFLPPEVDAGVARSIASNSAPGQVAPAHGATQAPTPSPPATRRVPELRLLENGREDETPVRAASRRPQ